MFKILSRRNGKLKHALMENKELLEEKLNKSKKYAEDQLSTIVHNLEENEYYNNMRHNIKRQPGMAVMMIAGVGIALYSLYSFFKK